MKIKPKRLSLTDIWKLYLLLEPAINDRDSKDSMLDEALEIIALSSPEFLLNSIHIMYGNDVRFNTPMEFNSLFIAGLARCEFFGFCKIIRGMNGVSKQ